MLAESLLLYRKKLGEQHHGGECVMENIFSLCICIFSVYMEPHAWFHHNPPFEPAVLGLLMTPTHSCYSVTSLPSSSMHHHTTHRRLRETINIVKMRSSKQPVQIITPKRISDGIDLFSLLMLHFFLYEESEGRNSADASFLSLCALELSSNFSVNVSIRSKP